MKFDVLTIFPEFFRGPFEHGVVARARETGLLDIAVHDLRNWTHDRHRTVDDRPFGGGEGMLLKPEPLFRGGRIDLARARPQGEKLCCCRRRAACSTRTWRGALLRSTGCC